MDKEVIKLLIPNYRGVTTDHLVYMLQDMRDAVPEDEAHKYYLDEAMKAIEAEILRRRRITYEGVQFTNKEIIQTIKGAVDIDTVLSWYTEVFTHKRQWTYRCTLHGKDASPSGVIYKDENKFHCFACNAHGDVLDAVMLFERVDLPAAIKKLARFAGLDVKPLIKNNYKDARLGKEVEQLQCMFKHLNTRLSKIEKKVNGLTEKGDRL